MALPHRTGISIELLPAEIIYEIVSHLSPFSLASLSQTCKSLRSHAENDLIWARFVKENVPNHPRGLSPFPCKTWKKLYLSHLPYWFIPRHKIWFSDRSHSGSTMIGSMIVARYDPQRACIEGYRLVVEHGSRDSEVWEWNPEVVIHTFNPRLQLWLDDPIIKLDPTIETICGSSNWETRMQTGATQGIRSTISLCQAIPESLQDPSMALWPPATLPATQRVRNESQSMFLGHMPRSLSQASSNNFRVRKWLEFGGIGRPLGIKMGHQVMTFSSLPEESYIPTEKKPWQGIWVGDYSSHGCEFLVVLQGKVNQWKQPMAKKSSQDSIVTTISTGPGNDNIQDATPNASFHTANTDADFVALEDNAEQTEDEPDYGRLEAIKLTGDPNIPRGEYTWIAEDIGSKGLIRVAQEQVFKGARIVKSLGHIAAREFRNGKSSVQQGYHILLTNVQINI